VKESIYSRNAVYEALRAGRRQAFQLLLAEGAQEKGRLTEIAGLAQGRKIPIQKVPRSRLDKIHANHQGVALEVSGYPYADLTDMLELAAGRQEKPFLLLLDALNDPQNFGTLLRTAEAVGVHGAVIPLARTVEVTPAVVNASSGASEHLLIAQGNLSQVIDQLKTEDIWIIGLDQEGEAVSGSAADRRLQGAVGLVVGSEGEGMRPLVRSKCDFLLRLPMRGQVESLNAAVAGSVALYLAYLARSKS
jgi:23S rRNA (guanosine2251-2'-O)-methyltransferase